VTHCSLPVSPRKLDLQEKPRLPRVEGRRSLCYLDTASKPSLGLASRPPGFGSEATIERFGTGKTNVRSGVWALQEDRRAVSHLKKIPIFKTLSANELTTLGDNIELSEARRRRVIYMPGDPGNTVFFVISGRVKISRVTPDGKELTLAYRAAGDLFGELCMVDGGPREEMAEAVEDAILAQMPREKLDKVVSEHVEIGFAMTKMMIERRRALERKMEDLIFKDVNSKLAELLLKLSKSYGVDDDRGTMVAIKMTHQEMANLIGSTRETVSLTLSQFKRKKLIQTDSRKVIITDREGLRALI